VPCPGPLGREERLEGPAADLVGHAGAGVRDAQAQLLLDPRRLARTGLRVGARGDGVGDERQRPALGHGVARVQRQVEQHALQLRPVASRDRAASAQLGADRDPRVDRAHEQLHEVVDDRVHVHRRRLRDLLAGERQQLARQIGRPQGDLRDGRGVLASRRVLDPARQELGVSEHHRQLVVEVVGDPPRELSDRLELLCLPEPLLGAHHLGRVTHDRHDVGDAPRLDDRDLARLRRDLATLDGDGLGRDQRPGAGEDAQVLVADGLGQEREDLEDVATDDLARDPDLPHPALAVRVQELDAQVLVHDVDRLAHRVDGHPVPVLGPAQRLLHPAPRGDAAADSEDGDATRATPDGGVDLDRRQATVGTEVVDLEVAD